MENKKSFLLYCDIIHTVNQLPDEQAGKLFKIILEYVNDLNPEVDDLLLSVTFEPIKQQLKRDLVKYKNICERNRANGANGGRPKKPKKPSGLSGNPKKPKKPDNDTDTDTDNDIELDIYPTFEDFWDLYDKKVGKKEKVKSKWDKLPQSVKEKIIEHIPMYVASQPEKKYRKNPETYLNNEAWNDELITNKNIFNDGKREQLREITKELSIKYPDL